MERDKNNNVTWATQDTGMVVMDALHVVMVVMAMAVTGTAVAERSL